MSEFVMTMYELATLLVPFLVAYAAVHARAQSVGRDAIGLTPALAFALYVFAVLYVTGVGTVFDLIGVVGGADKDVAHINLHPFWGGVGTGVVLNAVMFAPLGFLLPFIWRRSSRLAATVGFGFAFSLAIELTQLLNNRATDIDDLLMNTLGTLMGFVLFKIWERATSRIERRSRHAAYPGNLWSGGREMLPGLAEPALYLGVMFAGRFFLFDEAGAARLLFGS